MVVNKKKKPDDENYGLASLSKGCCEAEWTKDISHPKQSGCCVTNYDYAAIPTNNEPAIVQKLYIDYR